MAVYNMETGLTAADCMTAFAAAAAGHGCSSDVCRPPTDGTGKI